VVRISKVPLNTPYQLNDAKGTSCTRTHAHTQTHTHTQVQLTSRGQSHEPQCSLKHYSKGKGFPANAIKAYREAEE